MPCTFTAGLICAGSECELCCRKDFVECCDSKEFGRIFTRSPNKFGNRDSSLRRMIRTLCQQFDME